MDNDVARYGTPNADQILRNRFYTVGYSYHFRQALWALEIIEPDGNLIDEVERLDNFRPDVRVPIEFRAELSDYSGSGYDRGHLAASDNLDDSELQNSETFLLSNMSPQVSSLNRGPWAKLEAAIRKKDESASVLETYVLTGPLFDFTKPIKILGKDNRYGKHIPVPSHFFKCILTESRGGTLRQWAFIMPNKKGVSSNLSTHIVPTEKVEQWAGFVAWAAIRDPAFLRGKEKIYKIWS